MPDSEVVSIAERDRNVLKFQYVVTRAANRLALAIEPSQRNAKREDYKGEAKLGLIKAATAKGDALTEGYAMVACKNAIIDYQRRERRHEGHYERLHGEDVWVDIVLDCDLTSAQENECTWDYSGESYSSLDLNVPEAGGIEAVASADASKKAIAELTLANIAATAERGLAKLSEPTRTILRMSSYLNEGGTPATYREIAAATGLSLNKVFRERKKALEALRAIAKGKQAETALSNGKSPARATNKGPRKPFEHDKAFYGTIARDTASYIDPKTIAVVLAEERGPNPKRGVKAISPTPSGLTDVKETGRKCEHGHYWAAGAPYAWACFDDTTDQPGTETKGIPGLYPVSCEERYKLGLPVNEMTFAVVKENGYIVSDERAAEIRKNHPEELYQGRPMFGSLPAHQAFPSEPESNRTNYKQDKHSTQGGTITDAYDGTRLAYEDTSEPQSSALNRNSIHFLPNSFYGAGDHFPGWLGPNGEFVSDFSPSPEKAQAVKDESLARASEYNEWYENERPAMPRPPRSTNENPTPRSLKTEGK